tara:strand:+ start:130 stop:675 length:546 start_codon:yes stop_codon:yes gene_type:complete
MGEADWLGKIAKKHKFWIRIVNGFGEYDYAEDIVQEMYLIIYKYADETKIINNGIVNDGYIFYTLRTCFLAFCKAKDKIKKVRLDGQYNFTQVQHIDEMDEQIAFNKITNLIDNHIEKWRWYDRQLFKLYRDTDMSIRKIASETKISWVSIFNTLKKCKKELKDLFTEDYEDYKNQDYDRI